MGKKTIALLLVTVLSLLGSPSFSYIAPSVVVNGQKLNEEVLLHNDRVFVPLRAVSETLGASVGWDPDTYVASVDLVPYGADFSSILSDVFPSVVAIIGSTHEQTNGKKESVALGSGVVYTSGGEIITNAHVVEDMSPIIVVLHDGSAYEAKVKYVDQDVDLAVIKINKLGLRPIVFADPDEIRPGKPVAAIGTPLSMNYRNAVTQGIISGEATVPTCYFRMLQTDAAINGGNSGGALINKEGHLVGINSCGYAASYADNMGFSIPVQTVRYVLSCFETYGKVVKLEIGVSFDEPWTAAYGLPSQEGLKITKVSAGSLAEQAGFKVGDVLKQVGEQSVHSLVDYHEALKQYTYRDNMIFQIERGGTPVSVTVTAPEK